VLGAAARPAGARQVSSPLGGGDAAVISPPVAGDAFASVPADYRLDIGDVINVSVLRHPDVGGSFTIPADGTIRLARLRAPVNVRFKTCGEVARALAEGWRGVFVLRPGAVNVSVAAARVRRIYVRGNAVKGGDYDLKPDWRVSELVAILGGVPQPERVTAQIINARRPAPLTIDLNAALNTPGSDQNVSLLEGDTLLIDAPKTVRLLVYGEGPKGQHEVDNRYGLRRALTQLAYSTNNATGSLRDARLYRKAVPGDPNSDEEMIPVDLVKLMASEAPEIPLRDMDLLVIPPTERYVYIFGEAGTRKQLLPEDRKTFLADVLAPGGTSAQARIGDIGILREVNGTPTRFTVDFGRYLKSLDPKHNPEILPRDIVYVPKASRIGPGDIFNGWGVFNIFRTIFAGGLL
jgi:protein involved in polysaccharide export with SLBB domain